MNKGYKHNNNINKTDDLLILNLEERILRSFEQNYNNSFLVSCHGIYENATTFKVPIGCKLIFTTWLGKLGEADNYQENEIFRDLQSKQPMQFNKFNKNKKSPVIPEILQKDNFWGRSDRGLFSNRIIYNEGDICPNLHMKMDNDNWTQGFFKIPILKNLHYYHNKFNDTKSYEKNCENKKGADYWWEEKQERDLNNNIIEGDNPGWKSHMSKKLRKQLTSKKDRQKTIKAVFTSGNSDSTEGSDSDKTGRWGAQRTISNVLHELCSNNIKGVFIITLCRPSITAEMTHYDQEYPRTLLPTEVKLTRCDLHKIQYIENKQKKLNIKYQVIYNKLITRKSYNYLVNLKKRADVGFLENLPHYESDISLCVYITNIINILYNKDDNIQSNESEKELIEWMDNLLKIKLKNITPPINDAIRQYKLITGPVLNASDIRYNRLITKYIHYTDIQLNDKIKNSEQIRRKRYETLEYLKWHKIAKTITNLTKKTLPEIKILAKKNNILLSSHKKKKNKIRLIMEIIMNNIEHYINLYNIYLQ